MAMSIEEQREELFCDYFERWIKDYKEGVVRHVTLIKYHMAAKRLREIAPNLRMKDLTRNSYQNILNEYALTHEKTTTSDFHHQLRASLVDAFDDGVLERDISHRAVIKGKLPTINKCVKYIGKKDLEKLLEVLELGSEINWDWFIMLVAKTGLRFEEALALTPEDFDFNNLRLNINKAFDYKLTNTFCKTKNESSVRTILLDFRTAMQFENLIKGMNVKERIFKLGKGEKIYSSTANDRLRKLCLKAGIPVITIHGLRHTHASVLMYEGVTLSTISRRLGHSSMATTQNVYLHMIRELECKDESKIMASMMELR